MLMCLIVRRFDYRKRTLTYLGREAVHMVLIDRFDPSPSAAKITHSEEDEKLAILLIELTYGKNLHVQN